MRIHNLYEDEHGESHWRDIEVEWTEATPAGSRTIKAGEAARPRGILGAAGFQALAAKASRYSLRLWSPPLVRHSATTWS